MRAEHDGRERERQLWGGVRPKGDDSGPRCFNEEMPAQVVISS